MNLLRRALPNLVLFLIGFGVLLFLPAWTVDFWQGWVYLALLGALSAAITIHLAVYDEALLERRLKAGPQGETRTSQRIIQATASPMLGAAMVVAGLDHRLHWSAASTAISMAADVVIVLSFVLIFFVFRENTFSSGVIEVAEDQRVVSTGPYAVVRHPMYTGGIVFMLATPLALGSWWALIPAVMVCALIVIRLLDEESFLADSLPGYPVYCARIRWRLVPGLW